MAEYTPLYKCTILNRPRIEYDSYSLLYESLLLKIKQYFGIYYLENYYYFSSRRSSRLNNLLNVITFFILAHYYYIKIGGKYSLSFSKMDYCYLYLGRFLIYRNYEHMFKHGIQTCYLK